MINSDWMRHRITELRVRKGISEIKMSKAIGKSRSYINRVVNGKFMPQWDDFFHICAYLGVSPHEFFNPGLTYPEKTGEAAACMARLSEEDQDLALMLLRKLADR